VSDAGVARLRTSLTHECALARLLAGWLGLEFPGSPGKLIGVIGSQLTPEPGDDGSKGSVVTI
jgi:hypothetical protein